MASSNKNKNISKKVKPIQIPYPNDKTLWSYHMQAIEPINQEINKAFPEYHPMWVILSQSLNISGKQFNHLRESLLQMTIEQCSAYLRIKAWQIRAWENEKQPIPFMAFELLRLVYESAHFRLSHKDWAGWFISRDGRLVMSNGFEKFPKFSRKDRRKVSSLKIGLLVFYCLFPLFKSIGIVTGFQNIAVVGNSI